LAPRIVNGLLNFGKLVRSSEKPETMACLGQDTVKCKIVVDNKHLQHVKNFKYLGCEISYENEKNIQKI